MDDCITTSSQSIWCVEHIMLSFFEVLKPHLIPGLGPRKFRTRDVDLGDRSVWTDTPADKLKKKQVKLVHKDLGK